MTTDAPTSAPESPASRLGGIVRRLLPWALAVGLVAWIAQRVSFAEAWEAAQRANLVLFLSALGVAALYWFLLESRAFSFMFTRFNAPVSWAEARSLRGLTYLLTPINWNAGTAGILVYLRQTKGVSAVESGSSMLLYGAVDGVVIVSLLVVGALLYPASEGMRQALPWVGGFIGLQSVFLVLVMRDSPRWRWLDRVRETRLMQSYRKARLRDLGVLLGIRAAYFGGFALLFWWGTAAFDVHIPIGVVAMTMPIVMGSAMFTPAGVGGQQAAMLEVWKEFGDEASILAFAVAFPVGLMLVRVMLGLFYIRDLAEFRRVRAEAEQSEEPSPIS